MKIIRNYRYTRHICSYQCPECGRQWERETIGIPDDMCGNCDTRYIEPNKYTPQDDPYPEEWEE